MLAHPISCGRVEIKAIIILMKEIKRMHQTRLEFVFLSYLAPVYRVSW